MFASVWAVFFCVCVYVYFSNCTYMLSNGRLYIFRLHVRLRIPGSCQLYVSDRGRGQERYTYIHAYNKKAFCAHGASYHLYSGITFFTCYFYIKTTLLAASLFNFFLKFLCWLRLVIAPSLKFCVRCNRKHAALTARERFFENNWQTLMTEVKVGWGVPHCPLHKWRPKLMSRTNLLIPSICSVTLGRKTGAHPVPGRRSGVIHGWQWPSYFLVAAMTLFSRVYSILIFTYSMLPCIVTFNFPTSQASQRCG
jgi:hypothetical protein